ncbi:hypothetical protein BDV06DRAFT_198500 [Aspergillus oleicola]
MHENAIIAIITITTLSIIAACGTYLYYLRGNLKKEITIRRVEAQKERLQAVQVASTSLARERVQQRERERERERDRERAQVRKASASRARSRGRNRARSASRRGGRRAGREREREGPLLLVDLDRELEQVREGRERKGSRAPAVSRAGSTAPVPVQGEWGATDGLATNTVQVQPQLQQEQDQGQQQQDDWPAPAANESVGNNDDNNNSINDDWPPVQEVNETQDALGDVRVGHNGSSRDEWGNNNDDNNGGNAGTGGGWSADSNNQAGNDNNNNGVFAWESHDPMQAGQQETQRAAQNVPESMNW